MAVFCTMAFPARILAMTAAISLVASILLAETSDDVLVPIDLTDEENRSISLTDYQWTKRLLVVLADTANDPRFVEQLELLEKEFSELAQRDVIVLLDTDPSVRSRLRESLRPRGFAIILIGKEGQVRLRKPFPWSVREISRAIDKSPLRQRELRQGS